MPVNFNLMISKLRCLFIQDSYMVNLGFSKTIISALCSFLTSSP